MSGSQRARQEILLHQFSMPWSTATLSESFTEISSQRICCSPKESSAKQSSRCQTSVLLVSSTRKTKRRRLAGHQDTWLLRFWSRSRTKMRVIFGASASSYSSCSLVLHPSTMKITSPCSRRLSVASTTSTPLLGTLSHQRPKISSASSWLLTQTRA